MRNKNRILGIGSKDAQSYLKNSEIWWSTQHAGRSFFSYVKRFISRLLGIQTFENMSISNQILNEAHHVSYGRPWIVGISQIEYLRKLGLKETDSILDFGCGSGRLGIHLIKYLNKSKYFGVDSHFPSLYAFSQYELVINGLCDKDPQIMLNKNFEFDKFNQKFNFIIDFFVSKHLNEKQLDVVAKNIIENIALDGVYVLSPKVPYLQSKLESKGLIFEKNEKQVFNNEFQNIENNWVIMRNTKKLSNEY